MIFLVFIPPHTFNEQVTGRVEWRRRMQLVLQQLRSSTLLTRCSFNFSKVMIPCVHKILPSIFKMMVRHYSLYHTLGLTLDSISLIIVSAQNLTYSVFWMKVKYLLSIQYRFEQDESLTKSAWHFQCYTFKKNAIKSL